MTNANASQTDPAVSGGRTQETEGRTQAMGVGASLVRTRWRPADTIGYYVEARDLWKPARGADRRLTVKEAERAREAKQNELQNGTAKPKPSPEARMPWEEFCEAYLAETRGTVRDSTLQSYGESLRIFAEAVEPTTPQDVTPTLAKRFIQIMRDRGRSDATIKKHIASMRRVWNDPASQLNDEANPFITGRKGLRVRRTVQEKEWHWFKQDEIQSVLSACPDLGWRTRVFTAYTTALRLGELVNLRWCDVDLDALEVHVGSRKDTDETWHWVPKGKHRRTILLTGHAVGMIQRLRAATPCTPYVFVRPERYAEIQGQRAAGLWHEERDVVNNYLRGFHRILRRAGVPVDAFHSLRKSCTTNWLEAGVPPHEVQAMCGHASLETTMKYYSKVSIDAKARVRAASERYTAGVIA